TSIINFSSELKKRGHKVYIFASGTNSTKCNHKNKNIIVSKSIAFKNYPQYNIALFPFLSSIKLRKIKPDIIHLQTPFGMGLSGLLSSKFSRIPSVSTFHTMFNDKTIINEYVSKNKYIKTLLLKSSWQYIKFFYNNTNSIIVPSIAIKQILEKHGIKNNINIIPNGLNTQYFNPRINGSKTRKALGGSKNDKLVIYVGRLSREKKLETLIKASRLLSKNIKFIIIGDGPAFGYYKNLALKSNVQDRFKFLGFIDHKDLGKYYSASDLFCIPSTFETQGLVALEAMACNKPVVAANYLALKEIIKPGQNGEIFKPLDSASCAAKIKKVLNNIDSYKYNSSTAQNYSIQKMTDKLLDVYKNVIDSNKY
ncbi:MAG: glycosyltransferase, partial [Candidatus Marsarchaeota archaeon]|nr:glycosyltransferase [Candidatus Marsarchaeota archaeon]